VYVVANCILYVVELVVAGLSKYDLAEVLRTYKALLTLPIPPDKKVLICDPVPFVEAPIDVAPRNNKTYGNPSPSPPKTTETKANILFDADAGVIVAENPTTSTRTELEVDAVEV
jgi:hypothetical protein